MTRTSRAGWIALLVASVLLAINHVVVIFAVDDGDDVMLAVSAIINALTALVLIGPYRQGHAWAWWALWPQVLMTTSVLLWGNETAITTSYVGIAVVLAALTLIIRPNGSPRSEAHP